MSNKKRVRAFSQKAIVYLVALTIILGAGILAPKITNAEEPGFDDQAIYGAAEAVLGQSFTIFARTGDTEDTAGKPQAEWTAGFKTYLYYKNHYADTWATRIEGVYAGGGFFRYTMSGGPGGLFGYATRGDVGERDTTSSCVDPDNDDCDNVCTAETRDTNECIDNSFDYYLKTIDSDGNSTCWAPSTWTSSDLSLYYPGEGPAAVEFGSCNKTENLVRVYPDVSLSSGYEAKKISGGVKVDGAAVEDAWVFIENIGRAEQTDVDGNFTLDWLVWNDNYDLNALYLDGESNPWKGEMWSIAVGTTSEINLYPTGEGNMEEGGPGSGGMGDIMYTCPDDGMMGAPMDIIAAVGQIQAPILVAFTKPMDASTINADNIFLWKVNPNKSFDFELNPAGTAGSAFEDSGIDYSVGYYDPQADPKLFNFYFGPDPMAVIYIAPGATKLSPATQYVVELPPTIKDASANPLQGARPEGGHMFMFGTSGGDFMDEGPGDDYGTGGMYMPPFVTNISPMSGSFGIPENANILINFSEPMDGTSINQDAGTTQGNVRVYKITSTAGGESSVEKPVQVELDKSSKMTAVITPTGGFITTGTGHYRIEVRGGAKNSSGITMGPPGVDQSNFQSDFEVDITKTDSTAPTVLATNLEMYTLSSGVYTDIPTNQVIEVAFTEEMNPTTITANTILVKLGTKAVSGTVKYDPGMQQARFIPSSAFNANNTTYTLTIAGGENGVTDLAGLYPDKNWTANFKTVADADTEKPTLSYISADDYSAAVTFSKQMNAAKMTDTTKWSSSALNSSNYAIKSKPASAENWFDIIYTSATFSYDAGTNTVSIDGIYFVDGMSCTNENPCPLVNGEDIKVIVNNVADISGNAILADSTVYGIVQSSEDTYGMMGPMMGGMMGPPSEAGGMMMPGDFGMHDAGNMGMMGMMMGPVNPMAGATTHYFLDLMLTKQIPASGQIVLTFPSGFDVSGAALDDKNPCNSDINGPEGEGTVTIATVVGDKEKRTITITLGGVPTADPADVVGGWGGNADFIHFELKDIKNSVIPKDFNTSGYTIDVKTKNAVGTTVIESFTTPPFFITKKGNYTVEGEVTANEVGINGVKVYLMPMMMGGPMEAVTAEDGSYSFTDLNEGNYDIMTDPLITVGETGYFGMSMPEPFWISADTTTNEVYTKNIALTSTAGKASVTVTLKGDFGTDKVDIFAGGPSGHNGLMNQDPGDATAGKNYTIYFSVDGEYNVGIGQAMPMTMMMGPPPMTDWMPPTEQRVIVSGGEATPNAITFDISNSMADKHIIGYIQDADGNPVPDAKADAFRYEGMGMPSFAKTDATGKFDLKVGLGTYGIHVWKPGLPPMPEKTVMVKDVDGGYKVYLEGGIEITETNKLIFRTSVSSRTISGKVLDNADSALANPVPYTPVWAYNSTTGMDIPSGTDSSGKFILYVPDGTWNVSAFVPGLGDLPAIEVTIDANTGSVSGKVIKPSANVTYYTIEGTVTLGGDPQKWMPIRAVKITSDGYYAESYGGSTDENGKYRITVPSTNTGYYRIDVWTPEFGELEPNTDEVPNNPANIIVTSNRTGIDITCGSAGMVTLSFALEGKTDIISDNTRFFVDVFNPMTGWGNGTEVTYVSSTPITETIKVKAGEYHIMAHVPGVGELPAAKLDETDLPARELVDLSASGGETKTITFIIPSDDYWTVSGTVYIGTEATGNEVSGDIDRGFIWIENPDKGYHNGSPIGSEGNYSFNVPEAIGYQIGVDKPGFYTNIITLNVNANKTQNIVLIQNDKVISGTINDENVLPISGAWVWADKVEEIKSVEDVTYEDFVGGWSGSNTDAKGEYTLSAGAGYYLIRAVSPGYQEKTYTSVVNLTNVTSTIANIQLEPMEGFIYVEPKFEKFTPAKGIFFEDKEGVGMKFVAPGGILGTENTKGDFEIRMKSAPTTSFRTPIEGMGRDIIIKDPSGGFIRDLGEATADIEISYDPDWVETQGYSINDVKLSHWNTDTKQWEDISATNDTVNHVLIAKVSQFSLFAPTVAAGGGNAPTTPGKPTGTAATEDKITLTWTASTAQAVGATIAGYEVYRDTSTTGTFPNISGNAEAGGVFDSSVLVGNVTSTPRTWDDTTAVVNTTYYYKVAGFDNSGNRSTASLVSNGIIISSTTSTPLAPSNLTATAASSSSISLTWIDNSEIETGFKLYRNLADANWDNANTIIISSVTSTTNTGLAASTLYYYRIKAFNTAGSSDWSNTTSTTTLAAEVIESGGGGGGSSIPVSVKGQGNITGSSGGEVSQTFESGKTAKVTFPAKAITGTIVVTIEAQDKTVTIETNPLPENTQIVGDLVANFKAFSGGKELKSFEKDVTIQFTYTDEQVKGLDEKTLKIYYWDGSQWIVLDSTVNTIANTITATTNHFTYYIVLASIVKEEETVPTVKLTIEELKVKIAELVKQIAVLQAQIQQIKSIKVIPADYKFEKNLKYGQKSLDIKYLQEFLKAQGIEIYPQGLVTSYFGPLTKAAVIRFQEKYALDILAPWNLTAGTGFIGKTTRAKINEILSQ